MRQGNTGTRGLQWNDREIMARGAGHAAREEKEILSTYRLVPLAPSLAS
ncbi:MAG: hypothetical protein RL042_1323 [Nitrospirota bacterium]